MIMDIDIQSHFDQISRLKDDISKKNIAAIYYLVKDNKIVYIGMTEKLQERMKKHYRKVKENIIDDDVLITLFDGKLLHKLEVALVNRLKPIGNRRVGKNKSGNGGYYF